MPWKYGHSAPPLSLINWGVEKVSPPSEEVSKAMRLTAFALALGQVELLAVVRAEKARPMSPLASVRTDGFWDCGKHESAPGNQTSHRVEDRLTLPAFRSVA